MAGRKVEELPEITFSTGKVARIRRVSPMLASELSKGWVKKNPPPQAPMQEVKYGTNVRLEANHLNPAFMRDFQQWAERQAQEVGDLVVDAMIIRGLEIEVDTNELSELREQMRQPPFEMELTPIDKLAYVRYLVLGSPEDIELLRDSVMLRSQPTKEAIDDAVAAFQGDVQGAEHLQMEDA